MIVKNPIGPVKIENMAYRLTVGKPVPAEVLEFWKKDKQLEQLIKSGAISESKKEKITDDEPVRESKGSKSKNSKQRIFDSSDNRESPGGIATD